MKTLFTTILTLLLMTSLLAQTPQGFNYQGVARDLSGNPMPNSDIALRIAILQGNINGIETYKETHSVTTSDLGLFTLQIGTGTAVNGVFDEIDWGADSHYLQIEMDENNGTNYQLIGTSQLMSVPYALHARNGSKWEDDPEGIRYDSGIVSIENNNTATTRRGLRVETGPIDGFADYVVGVHSKIEAGRGYAVGIQGSAYSEIPSNAGRSYAIRAVAGNSTPGANFAIFGQLQGSNNGAAVLGYDKITYPSWGIVIPANRPWAGYFVGGVHITDELGIGTNQPTAKLQVADGDIYIEDINQGVIMKSPNGQCWRLTIDNNGQLVPTAINCP